MEEIINDIGRRVGCNFPAALESYVTGLLPFEKNLGFNKVEIITR